MRHHMLPPVRNIPHDHPIAFTPIELARRIDGIERQLKKGRGGSFTAWLAGVTAGVLLAVLLAGTAFDKRGTGGNAQRADAQLNPLRVQVGAAEIDAPKPVGQALESCHGELPR